MLYMIKYYEIIEEKSMDIFNERYQHIINKYCSISHRKPYINYAAVIIYKLLFDVIYCIFIGNKHTSCYLNLSAINIINGWLMMMVMGIFVNKYCEQKTNSAILMIIFNLIYFIPLTTYCGYGGGSSSFLFFGLLYWAILSMLQIEMPVISFELNSKELGNSAFYIAEAFISVISVYMWGKYTDFRLLINIANIYEIRAEAAAYQIPTVLAYIRLLSPILISMLIILALNRRRYLSLIWLLFITWINFSFAGDKSIVLFPIVLIGGYIFYRQDMIYIIVPMGVLLQIVAIIEQLVGKGYLVSFLFRRQGIELPSISEEYYRFFLEHPTDIFRQGILGKLGFDSIYSNNLANVIGNNFQTQAINCNNGLLSDVWCNLGIMGLIVMPIILIICFRILDLVSCKLNTRLTIGITLYYGISFTNSSWSTVLLSHGFIMICIMLVMFPKNSRKLTIT